MSWLAGFKREDLFTVVHDLFMTDTADYADIVLPATSQLEQVDLHKAYGHRNLQYNHAAIAPLGEAKPNTEVFRLLARALGFEPELFEESDEDLAARLQSDGAGNFVKSWEDLLKRIDDQVAVVAA